MTGFEPGVCRACWCDKFRSDWNRVRILQTLIDKNLVHHLQLVFKLDKESFLSVLVLSGSSVIHSIGTSSQEITLSSRSVNQSSADFSNPSGSKPTILCCTFLVVRVYFGVEQSCLARRLHLHNDSEEFIEAITIVSRKT